MSFSKTEWSARRTGGLARLVVWVLAMLALGGQAGAQAPATAPPAAASAAWLPGTPAALTRARELTQRYLALALRPTGGFVDQYNFITHYDLVGEDPVMQAGGLWALAQAHRQHPTPESAAALTSLWEYFRRLSVNTPDMQRYLSWPEAAGGQVAAVALVTLAQVAMLQANGLAEQPELRQKFIAELTGHLRFLLACQEADGRFLPYYSMDQGQPRRAAPASVRDTAKVLGLVHPVTGTEANAKEAAEAAAAQVAALTDSAVLLALLGAESVLGHEALQAPILKGAAAFDRAVLLPARQPPATAAVLAARQAFPLAAGVFAELARRPWAPQLAYGDRLLSYATWLVEVARVPDQREQQVGTVPGLLAARDLARERGLNPAAERYQATASGLIQRALKRQIGGPLSEGLPLPEDAPRNPRAVGGVLDELRPAILRLDHGQQLLQALLAAGQ